MVESVDSILVGAFGKARSVPPNLVGGVAWYKKERVESTDERYDVDRRKMECL